MVEALLIVFGFNIYTYTRQNAKIITWTIQLYMVKPCNCTKCNVWTYMYQGKLIKFELKSNKDRLPFIKIF